VLEGLVVAAILLFQQQPVVPARYAKAVDTQVRLGMELVDLREAPTPAPTCAVAIYRYPEADPLHGGMLSLRVHRPGQDGTSSTRILAEDAYVAFGTYDSATVFADVNRDGVVELIASVANGGNCWACSRVVLYGLGAEGPVLLADEAMRLEDLDGDGRLELLVGDARWESYRDFSHAAAPGGTLVYAWLDGAYRFAGPRYQAFYRAEAERLEADLAEAIRLTKNGDEFGEEVYLRDTISLYLVSVYAGRAEQGRAEFRSRLEAHVPSEEARKRREQIRDDFLSGESASLLTEPRPNQRLR
jgi:hypothetical protein